MEIFSVDLVEQIYNLVWEKILCRDYMPGDQIPTKQIAQASGVSVMPVRLALQELTDRGILIKRQRVGYYVAKFSVEEMLDIVQTRKMFEMHCLDQHFSSLSMANVQRMHDLLVEINTQLDDTTYQLLDAELHQMFINASANKIIKKQYAQIKDLFTISISVDQNDHVTHELSRKEHLELLGHILAQDKQSSLISLKNHLDRVESVIRELL